MTHAAADAELRAIAAALEREHSNTNSAIAVRAVRLADRLVDGVRPTLLALFGAVGFLLLVACVNVAPALEGIVRDLPLTRLRATRVDPATALRAEQPARQDARKNDNGRSPSESGRSYF